MKENFGIGPQINVIYYLEVILHRKWMIFRITLVAFITAIIFTLITPKIYSSTTKLLPPQQDQGLIGLLMGQAGGGMATMAGNLLGKGSSADMFVSILKSESIQDAIIGRFDLMKVYNQKYRLDAYKVLDKKVIIESGKKDGIISITVEDRDPQRAANMANAYVEELGKLTAGINVSGAGRNRSFYEERLAKSRADLTLAEEALMKFQKKNKALNVVDQAKASIEGVAQLRGQLAMHEVQLDTMRRQFTDSSQEVKTQNATIGNIKAQIAKLEGNGNGGSIPSIGTVPSLGQQYVRLVRNVKIQEAIVEVLTKQYEMEKLNEARDDTSLQVIQKAKVPDKRIKPQRTKLVLFATAVALIFSVLLAFILDFIAKMPSEDKSRWQEFFGNLPLLKRFLLN